MYQQQNLLFILYMPSWKNQHPISMTIAIKNFLITMSKCSSCTYRQYNHDNYFNNNIIIIHTAVPLHIQILDDILYCTSV